LVKLFEQLFYVFFLNENIGHVLLMKVIPHFEEKSPFSIEVAFPYIQGFSPMFHNNFVGSNDVTCQPKTLAYVRGRWRKDLGADLSS
jgi:hypothetical protein